MYAIFGVVPHFFVEFTPLGGVPIRSFHLRMPLYILLSLHLRMTFARLILNAGNLNGERDLFHGLEFLFQELLYLELYPTILFFVWYSVSLGFLGIDYFFYFPLVVIGMVTYTFLVYFNSLSKVIHFCASLLTSSIVWDQLHGFGKQT